MKNTLILAEYNLRAIRKPLIWTCILMGPIEFCVMMAYLVVMKGPLFHPPHRFFMAGMIVPAVCILIVVVLNFLTAMRQNGRSKAIYTLLTLPGNRTQIYISGIISGLIAVWLTAAVQAIWYMLLYAPAAWSIDWYSVHFLAEKVESGLLPAIPEYSAWIDNGFYLNMMRSPAMRMLFPMSLHGFAVMLISEVSFISALQAISYTRGWMRNLTIAAFIVCASGTAILLRSTVGYIFVPEYYVSVPMDYWLFAAQIISSLISMICAGYSLKHSRVI